MTLDFHVGSIEMAEGPASPRRSSADITARQKLITTLHRADCAVLWLQPAGLSSHTFTDATTVTVAYPADAVAQIADAAITTLGRV